MCVPYRVFRGRDFHHAPFDLGTPHHPLDKGPINIERLISYEHVITGLCQFIGDRFLGYEFLGAVCLALIIALYLWLPYRGIMCGLHEGIFQILIAILTIAFAFLFTITDLFAGDAPRIRGIVDH